MANLRNLKIIQTKVNVKTGEVWQLGLDDQNGYWTIVNKPTTLKEGRQAFIEEQLRNNFGANTDLRCDSCGSTSRSLRLSVANYNNTSEGVQKIINSCSDEWHGVWP